MQAFLNLFVVVISRQPKTLKKQYCRVTARFKESIGKIHANVAIGACSVALYTFEMRVFLL